MQHLASLAILLSLTQVTVAQEVPPPDKSAYSLLNPTPKELWRPLRADRPDFTESPYTVDAGAVQIEMSFVDYAHNGDSDSWTAAPINLKIGLLNDVDLQLVFDPYVHEKNGRATRDGVGDTQVRLKINLWGNDGGKTAFAIMPFLKIPTASHGLGNNKVEGGVIFPLSTDIAEGVGLGLMFETDFVYDETDDGYDTEFILTAVVGFDLTDDLGFYIEGIGIESTDSGSDSRAILGLGFTHALSTNTVIDVGVNFGLAGDADDVNIFAGLTLRF